MNRRTASIVFGLAVLASGGAVLVSGTVPEPKAASISLPCQVAEVTDGDTVKLVVAIKVNARLLECWAAESRGARKSEAGIASKAALKARAEGCDGIVTIPIPDGNLSKAMTLDRMLVYVTLDGDSSSLSEHQVKDGMAFKTKEELVKKYPDQK